MPIFIFKIILLDKHASLRLGFHIMPHFGRFVYGIDHPFAHH